MVQERHALEKRLLEDVRSLFVCLFIGVLFT